MLFLKSHKLYPVFNHFERNTLYTYLFHFIKYEHIIAKLRRMCAPNTYLKKTNEIFQID